MEIGFEWDAPALGRLSRAVGLEDVDDENELQTRVTELARVALDELAAWAAGTQRFTSVSEQDRLRVLALFARVRSEPVSTEALVDDLGFPESRAKTIVSRMRYQDASALRAMRYKQALNQMRNRLDAAAEDEGTKHIYLSKDDSEAIREAESAILLGPLETYPERVELDTSVRRYDVSFSTKLQMWEYLDAWLENRIAEFGP